MDRINDQKNQLMKAVVCEEFGTADVLELKEISIPKPKADQVLIRNHGSAINALDITFRSGRKVLSGLDRVLMSGIRKPRISPVGLDGSGEIVSIGKKNNKIQDWRSNLWCFNQWWGLCGIYVLTRI